MTDYNGNLKPKGHTQSILCQVHQKSSPSLDDQIMCKVLNQSSLDIVSDPYSFIASVNTLYKIDIDHSPVQT